MLGIAIVVLLFSIVITGCAPLLFLHVFHSEFVAGLIKNAYVLGIDLVMLVFSVVIASCTPLLSLHFSLSQFVAGKLRARSRRE